MKASLSIGTSAKLTTRVGSGNTITLGNTGQATVFSTPSMINLMELAARDALLPHLDDGEDSVGVDVHIDHTAATPPHNQVTAEAVVVGLNKNVVSFDVVARDDWGEIGSGTHRRAVIDTHRFAGRLAEQKHPPAPERTPAQNQPTETPPSMSTIECRQAGSTLHVTLNRPQKRNAICQQMTQELEGLLGWLETSGGQVRSVIVSGTGETFCAGDDVGDLPEDLEASRRLSTLRGELYLRITELPQVFIAMIDGLALGGGLVLAAACDFRVAAHRAEFGLPEAVLGWPPNYGMQILQSLIGRGQTLQLALSGQPIDARTAHSIGLVSQVMSADRLDAAANRLAEQSNSMSALALSHVKQLLSPQRAWSDQLAGDAFVECLTSDQARQSVRLFKS